MCFTELTEALLIVDNINRNCTFLKHMYTLLRFHSAVSVLRDLVYIHKSQYETETTKFYGGNVSINNIV